MLKVISVYSLSLDLKQPTVAGSEDTSSSAPLNPPAAVLEASVSSHTVSSSLDTFHTATSPCSAAGDQEAVNGDTKHAVRRQGSDDSDELSSTEDSYLRSSGINHSEHSTSSFEKVSPPTEIHRQRKTRLMNGKVS